MRSLLSIDDLNELELRKLVDTAIHHPPAVSDLNLSAPPVALVFAEPSTRTRISFEQAAAQLGRRSILISAGESSLTKNESLEDTVLNLQALGCGTFVLRVPTGLSFDALRGIDAAFVNAGNGMEEHPTQALLDLATILDKRAGGDWKKLSELSIVISGDLKHSRVVGSWSRLAQKLNLNVKWCRPDYWARPDAEARVGEVIADRDEALKQADVWMGLRVQKERFQGENFSLEDYCKSYQVSSEQLERAGVALLHPGPVNWGIELSEDVRRYGKSLILDQVKTGVALRASLLKFLQEDLQN